MECSGSVQNVLGAREDMKSTVTKVGQARVHEDAELVTVSLARAAALKAERRKRCAENLRAVKQDEEQVREHALQEYLNVEWEKLDGETQHAHNKLLEVAHKSHRKLVTCGGYVGCINCGRFASTQGKNNHLRQECRGKCPTGSIGATRRMLFGKHPLAGKAKAWPSRETAPRPKRIAR